MTNQITSLLTLKIGFFVRGGGPGEINEDGIVLDTQINAKPSLVILPEGDEREPAIEGK